MAFWIGLYPKPFFQILESPVNQIVRAIQNNPATPVNAQAAPTPVVPAAAPPKASN